MHRTRTRPRRPRALRPLHRCDLRLPGRRPRLRPGPAGPPRSLGAAGPAARPDPVVRSAARAGRGAARRGARAGALRAHRRPGRPRRGAGTTRAGDRGQGMAVVADAAPLPWLEAPLREALARQRGHALLVQAPDGVGTWAFLRRLAQAWLCESPGDAPPCGRCAGCHLALTEAHPDQYLLQPESRRSGPTRAEGAAETDAEAGRAKKKPSRQIRIDEVRAAVDWATHSSSRGRAKVLVVHPAEAMNLQAASALLKSLEEPPGIARWLLGTADAAHLLPTVRSRCQRLTLPTPDSASALAWLGAQGVADAPVLLAAAGGRPLEALDLAAAGIDAHTWAGLPAAVAGGKAAAFLGWPVPRTVDALQKLCHDAQATAAGGRPRYFPPEIG